MAEIDAQLEPTVGPEASITLGTTLLTMWLAVTFIQFFTQRLGGRGRAIAGEDDDNVLSDAAMKGEQQYDVTVLLCGPQGGGKTRLFYELCTGDKNLPTLTSLKANVGIAARNLDRSDTDTVRRLAELTASEAPAPAVQLARPASVTRPLSLASCVWTSSRKISCFSGLEDNR